MSQRGRRDRAISTWPSRQFGGFGRRIEHQGARSRSARASAVFRSFKYASARATWAGAVSSLQIEIFRAVHRLLRAAAPQVDAADQQAHLLIGRIYLRGGRPEQAVDTLKISIWSEDTAPAHVALAEAYLKLGKTAEARADLERALVLDPSSEAAKRLLATLK